MTRSWYEIQARVDNSADVYLYDAIGVFGVTASQFVNEIRNLKAKTLNLYLNSPGGDAFDGVAIYNSLRRHPATVNVVVDSLAASAASFIAQAGDTRTMAMGSMMMIHEGRGIAMGPTTTMEKMAEELHLMDDNIAGIYAERAGGTKEEWRERMAAETWYNAEKAQEAGLADGVTADVQIAAEYRGRIFNLSDFKNVPEDVKKANEGRRYIASDINTYVGDGWKSGNTTINTGAIRHGLTGDVSADSGITTPNINFGGAGGTLYAKDDNLFWRDSNGKTTNISLDLSNIRPAKAVQTSPEGQEDEMDETAIRQALGLDGEGDIQAAITNLKAAATDIATGEKGAENQLRKDNATLRQQLLTQESDYGQRILALEDRNRQKEAAYAVDSAIQAGRVAPKDRDLALKLALNDADGFEAFARNLRVDLDERGRMADETEAAVALTKDEAESAKQMGYDPKILRAQKAKDAGITIPS